MAHVVVLDSLEDIFVCGPCKAVFNSLNLFMSHKKKCVKLTEESPEEMIMNKNVIHPDDTGVSGSMSISNATRKELEAGSNSGIWTNDQICSICKKKFKKIKNLLAHMRIHNGNTYQCPVCGRCFIQNSHLQRHYLSHKVWPDGLSETTAKSSEVELLSYSCPYCSMVISNYCQFRSHLKNHISVKKFKCIQGQCKEFYDTIEELIFHVRSSHVTPVYICHICSCSCDSLEEIARHQQGHKEYDRGSHTNVTQTKHYKCKLCDATFKRSERLSLHMLTENHRKARQFRVTDQVFFDIHRDDKPLGRIVIGLFGEMAPKAVKNFKVLATKGAKGVSYKGSSFNRIIKRFMVQGGDIVSDDGTGSISIYGETFDDENLDTQHSTAGFVSMANKGKNTNGCQFLITTTGTPWLDNLHTVIGKVVEGQNVVHMVEHTPTDVDDRPTRHVYIADCGLVPTPMPYYISDDPYDLWSWIKASAVPLSMSFSILGFFHWMMKKMEI